MYKYHFVYRTTNLVDGKFYIGVHSTNDINDGYLGSGKLLQRAIKKYGRDKFNRTIISFHESREQALKHEAELVEVNSNTYNLCEGGGSPPNRINYAASGRAIEKGINRTEKQKLASKQHSNRMKNRPAKNRKPVELLGNKYASGAEARKKLGLSVTMFYKILNGS